MAKTKDICAECNKQGNRGNGITKMGYWICGRCKRRMSFPKLFKRIYGEIPVKKKKRKRWRSFKKEEQIVLYNKHVKDMSAREFKEHMNKMRGIVSIVKSISRKNKSKPNFKQEFGKLTEKRRKHD